MTCDRWECYSCLATVAGSENQNQFCFKTTGVKIGLASLDLDFRRLFFAGLVAFGEAIRPDPIPNSAVKRLRANGTLSQDTGE